MSANSANRARRSAAWPLDDFRTTPLPPEPSTVPVLEADPVATAVDAAWSAGYEEGRRTGEIGEQARLAPVLAAAQSAVAELRAGEERWQGALGDNVIALAIAIARQIVDREVAADQAIVPRLVERALTEFPIDQPVRIRVNPRDLAAIESLSDDGTSGIGMNRTAPSTWLADARVAPGGAMVEGRERIIDGRVDTALARLYERLAFHAA